MTRAGETYESSLNEALSAVYVTGQISSFRVIPEQPTLEFKFPSVPDVDWNFSVCLYFKKQCSGPQLACRN